MTNHTTCTCSTFTPGISCCQLLPIALQGGYRCMMMYVSYQLVSETQTTPTKMSCGFPAVPRDLPKSYRVVQFREKVPSRVHPAWKCCKIPETSQSQAGESDETYTGWWFQIFFIFTPIWGRFPF